MDAPSRLATASGSQKSGREGEWKAFFFQQALTDTLVEHLLPAVEEDDTGH